MIASNKERFSFIEILAKRRGYSVSQDGTFYSNRGNVITYIDHKGYRRITLKIQGMTKVLFAHRLQAYQKYGMELYKKGIMVRHLDGNKTNNSVDNIALGTNRDNMMDVPSEIRRSRAVKAARQTIKYNRDEIIKYYEECGGSRKKTMEHFGISSSGTLHYILKKRKFNDKL